ncbi:NAD-dependent succinate-semialdehyde dehydrogenase [Corynebacterium hesseae]
MSQYRVQNPVNNKIIETFDALDDAAIEPILEASSVAFTEWSGTPVSQRAEIVAKAASLFEERKEELAAIIAEEMGKPLPEGVEEAEFSSAIIQYYADNAEKFLADQEIPTEADGKAFIRRRPFGPLLGIMPWNFPYYQVARFAGPNLVAGNTIILKHSEICPRSALAIEKIFLDAGLPAGVYTNVFATHEQISTLIADPRVQGVSLTGSERAGAIVGAQAGQHLKKAVLELGGSDPYVVLDTDDVKASAELAWGTRMYNTGQACNSNKRLIVAEDIYDEFVQELVNLAQQMEPGLPDTAGETVYAPLSSRSAAENLKEQLERAVSAGGQLLAGGELSEEGAYISPAVITDIPRGSDSYYEEFFGPVATVYKFKTDEEALEIANDNVFGLGAAVFSQDSKRAQAIAERIESGMSNVNTPTGEGPELPFGGVKRSGFGRELGSLGIEEFINKQMYFIAN